MKYHELTSTARSPNYMNLSEEASKRVLKTFQWMNFIGKGSFKRPQHFFVNLQIVKLTTLLVNYFSLGELARSKLKASKKQTSSVRPQHSYAGPHSHRRKADSDDASSFTFVQPRPQTLLDLPQNETSRKSYRKKNYKRFRYRFDNNSN